MRSFITHPAPRCCAALIATLTLIAIMTPSASAQPACVNEPALGFFDSNGDGVVTGGEVRAAAGDNPDFQATADQLDAVGGVQYAGCEPADGGSGDGDPGGSDAGSEGGEQDVPDDDAEPETGDDTGAADVDGADDAGTGTTSEDDEAADGDATPDAGDSVDFGPVMVTTLPGVGHGTVAPAAAPAFALVACIAAILAFAAIRVQPAPRT